MNYSIVDITLTQPSAKRYANNKKDVKNTFLINKGNKVSNHKYHTLLTFKITQTKNLLSETMPNKKSHCHEDTSIHKYNHVLPPQNRAAICTGVNASMTGQTMINAVFNYCMRLGVIKQSCAENFIAQKRQQNC